VKKKNLSKSVLIVFVLLMAGAMSACAPVWDQMQLNFGGSSAQNVRQQYTQMIQDQRKPLLVSVTMSGECDGNIEDYVSIENVYMKDHFSSDAAGLVGVPVRVSFHDVKDPELAFVYDPDKLHGMPEKNFVLLRANEKQQLYETVRLDRPDDNTYTVTASIREEGVYTLVDAYEWYAVFNQDVSEFEYEKE